MFSPHVDPGASTINITSSITNTTSPQRNNIQLEPSNQYPNQGSSGTTHDLKRRDSVGGRAKKLCLDTPPQQTSPKGKKYSQTPTTPNQERPNNCQVKNHLSKTTFTTTPRTHPTARIPPQTNHLPLKLRVLLFLLSHSLPLPLFTWTHITTLFTETIGDSSDIT